MRSLASIPAILFLLAFLGARCDAGPGPDTSVDESLVTEPDPDAPDVDEAWTDWIQNNHQLIRSLESEDYEDLQFLRPLLQEKRIVQLGESGHGVAQFNLAKVRLIKFLHQELGFEVIAFESPLYECYRVADQVDALSAPELMQRCIYGVWHTHEVVSLFDYIKESRHTERPLILAGFDVQINSLSEVQSRPQLYHDLLAPVDSAYAGEAHSLDSTFIAQFHTSEFATTADSYRVAYTELVSFMDIHEQELIGATPVDSTFLKVMRQTASSMVHFIDHIQYQGDLSASTLARDAGMADNVGFLLDVLYPDKKIVIWAHNFHARTDNASIPTYDGIRTMGSWIAERYDDEVYTVGLYMYRGQATTNQRRVYNIRSHTSENLEAILYQARRNYLFVDMLGEQRGEGNAWMFKPIQAKAWGTTDLTMVPREQYDGILYIDTVTPPDYYQSSGERSATILAHKAN